jgi:hypothetical protein
MKEDLPNTQDTTKTSDVQQRNSTSHPIVRQLEHPERKLTLLFIASSSLFALIGTFLGTFMLAALSGVPTNFGLTLFSAHPFLQIYGFIAEFVVGVAFSLLPRFKAGRVPSLGLAYAAYFLLTSANILFLLSATLSPYSTIFGATAALLIVIGSAVFASQVFSLASRPFGGFPETNPLMIISTLSLVLLSLALLLEEVGLVRLDDFSPQMIFLSLLGFAGSMIYTVEIRSVSFRQSDYRKRLAWLTSILQACAVAVIFISILLPSFLLPLLSIAGSTLFLASSLSMIFTIKIFEFSRSVMYKPAMTKMHFSILRYNEIGILSGTIWLLFGIILGITLIAINNNTIFFVRDSFIHSIAIGFIGSTIIVFAPMLLPSLLGKRAPVSGLSFGPIVVLNAGISLRVVGDYLTLVSHNNNSTLLPIWESVSGPLILGSMVWLLIVLHNVGRRPRSFAMAEAKAPVSVHNSDIGINNIRDATITVTNGETGKKLTVSVWFVVEENHIIYLIPRHGTKTKWYLEALSNPYVQLEINKQIFSGEAKGIVEKRQVEKVIRLFKNKYGERVYRNFYGDQIERALMVAIQ